MAVTRLGASGFPRPPYGSFAGKVEAVETKGLGPFTRLGVSGFPRPPYASFAGKSENLDITVRKSYVGFLANINRLKTRT